MLLAAEPGAHEGEIRLQMNCLSVWNISTADLRRGLIENGLLYIVICYSVHTQMNGPIAAHRSNGPIAAHRSNGPIAAHGTNGPIAAHRLNRPIAAHISLIRSNFTRCLYTTF